MEIEKRLSSVPVPDFVQKQWETDLIINLRGVAVDMPFVDGALIMDAQVKSELMQEATNISELDNPNSVKQLTAWLNKETSSDVELTDLRKATVSEMLNRDDNSPDVQRMLEIRQELGKTSTKNTTPLSRASARITGCVDCFNSMERTVQADGLVDWCRCRIFREPTQIRLSWRVIW